MAPPWTPAPIEIDLQDPPFGWPPQPLSSAPRTRLHPVAPPGDPGSHVRPAGSMKVGQQSFRWLDSLGLYNLKTNSESFKRRWGGFFGFGNSKSKKKTTLKKGLRVFLDEAGKTSDSNLKNNRDRSTTQVDIIH